MALRACAARRLGESQLDFISVAMQGSAFNTFIGQNAGNLTMTGSRNTASGVQALQNNTTGTNNTALGFGADVGSGKAIPWSWATV